MGEPGRRDAKAMWIGALISVLLFATFFYLEYKKSSILDLQPQWLIVAIIPLTVGLIVGGFIRELKAGDYGVDFSTEKILAKSQPIADGNPLAGKLAATASEISWSQERSREYARTRGYMLAHIYRPSKERGQRFDISIFVVQHQKGTTTPPKDNLDELRSAEFFFGDSWGNRVFTVSDDGGFFGVRTHAWGTFLAMCKITFKDPKITPITLFRYIDFSMASEDG